jgi:hypothetical protein
MNPFLKGLRFLMMGGWRLTTEKARLSSSSLN